MQSYSGQIIRFFSLLLFQTIILNNINIHGLVNPFVYPLFILLLPIGLAHGIVLLIGFLMGISVDIFSNSMGLHAFVSVFIAFVRPFILQSIAPGGGYEAENKPTIKSMGISWFATYTVIMILLHHSVLFFMEVLSFSNFGWTVLKIILSGIFSIALIFIWEYLFYPKKK